MSGRPASAVSSRSDAPIVPSADVSFGEPSRSMFALGSVFLDETSHINFVPGEPLKPHITKLVNCIYDGDLASQRDSLFLIGKAISQPSAAENADVVNVLKSMGICEPVLQCLESDASSDLRRASLRLLCNLSSADDSVSVEIRQLGGLSRVLDCLVPDPELESLETVRAALRTICNLSINDQNKVEIRLLGGLPKLVSALELEDSRTKLDALRAVCNLSIDPSNRVALGILGVCPFVINALQEHIDDEECTRYSLAALINLSSDSVNASQFIPAVPVLADILLNPRSNGILLFATRALCTLAYALPLDASVVDASGHVMDSCALFEPCYVPLLGLSKPRESTADDIACYALTTVTALVRNPAIAHRLWNAFGLPDIILSQLGSKNTEIRRYAISLTTAVSCLYSEFLSDLDCRDSKMLAVMAKNVLSRDSKTKRAVLQCLRAFAVSVDKVRVCRVLNDLGAFRVLVDIAGSEARLPVSEETHDGFVPSLQDTWSYLIPVASLQLLAIAYDSESVSASSLPPAILSLVEQPDQIAAIVARETERVNDFVLQKRGQLEDMRKSVRQSAPLGVATPGQSKKATYAELEAENYRLRTQLSECSAAGTTRVDDLDMTPQELREYVSELELRNRALIRQAESWAAFKSELESARSRSLTDHPDSRNSEISMLQSQIKQLETDLEDSASKEHYANQRVDVLERELAQVVASHASSNTVDGSRHLSSESSSQTAALSASSNGYPSTEVLKLEAENADLARRIVEYDERVLLLESEIERHRSVVSNEIVPGEAPRSDVTDTPASAASSHMLVSSQSSQDAEAEIRRLRLELDRVRSMRSAESVAAHEKISTLERELSLAFAQPGPAAVAPASEPLKPNVSHSSAQTPSTQAHERTLVRDHSETLVDAHARIQSLETELQSQSLFYDSQRLKMENTITTLQAELQLAQAPEQAVSSEPPLAAVVPLPQSGHSFEDTVRSLEKELSLQMEAFLAEKRAWKEEEKGFESQIEELQGRLFALESRWRGEFLQEHEKVGEFGSTVLGLREELKAAGDKISSLEFEISRLTAHFSELLASKDAEIAAISKETSAVAAAAAVAPVVQRVVAQQADQRKSVDLREAERKIEELRSELEAYQHADDATRRSLLISMKGKEDFVSAIAPIVEDIRSFLCMHEEEPVQFVLVSARSSLASQREMIGDLKRELESVVLQRNAIEEKVLLLERELKNQIRFTDDNSNSLKARIEDLEQQYKAATADARSVVLREMQSQLDDLESDRHSLELRKEEIVGDLKRSNAERERLAQLLNSERDLRQAAEERVQLLDREWGLQRETYEKQLRAQHSKQTNHVEGRMHHAQPAQPALTVQHAQVQTEMDDSAIRESAYVDRIKMLQDELDKQSSHFSRSHHDHVRELQAQIASLQASVPAVPTPESETVVKEDGSSPSSSASSREELVDARRLTEKLKLDVSVFLASSVDDLAVRKNVRSLMEGVSKDPSITGVCRSCGVPRILFDLLSLKDGRLSAESRRFLCQLMSSLMAKEANRDATLASVMDIVSVAPSLTTPTSCVLASVSASSLFLHVLHVLLDLISSADLSLVSHGLSVFRMLVSHEDSAKRLLELPVEREKCFRRLVDLVSNPLDDITRRNAVRSIKSLASSAWSSEQKTLLRNGDLIAALLQCIRTTNAKSEMAEDLVRQSMRALMIMCVIPEVRVEIRMQNGISPIVALLDARTSSPETRKAAAGALINLSVNGKNKEEIRACHGVPLLIKLTQRIGLSSVQILDKEEKLDAEGRSTFSFGLEGPEDHAEEDQETRRFSIRTISNLVLNDAACEEAVDRGLIPALARNIALGDGISTRFALRSLVHIASSDRVAGRLVEVFSSSRPLLRFVVATVGHKDLEVATECVRLLHRLMLRENMSKFGRLLSMTCVHMGVPSRFCKLLSFPFGSPERCAIRCVIPDMLELCLEMAVLSEESRAQFVKHGLIKFLVEAVLLRPLPVRGSEDVFDFFAGEPVSAALVDQFDTDGLEYLPPMESPAFWNSVFLPTFSSTVDMVCWMSNQYPLRRSALRLLFLLLSMEEGRVVFKGLPLSTKSLVRVIREFNALVQVATSKRPSASVPYLSFANVLSSFQELSAGSPIAESLTDAFDHPVVTAIDAIRVLVQACTLESIISSFSQQLSPSDWQSLVGALTVSRVHNEHALTRSVLRLMHMLTAEDKNESELFTDGSSLWDVLVEISGFDSSSAASAPSRSATSSENHEIFDSRNYTSAVDDVELQRLGMGILCNVSVKDEHKAMLGLDHSGIKMILSVIQSNGDKKVVRDGLRVLRNLSYDSECRKEINSRGVPLHVCRLLCGIILPVLQSSSPGSSVFTSRDSDDSLSVRFAVRILCILSMDQDNRVLIVDDRDCLACVIAVLGRSADFEARRASAGALINLSVHKNHKPKVRAAGAVPVLVQSLEPNIAGEFASFDAESAKYSLRALYNLSIRDDVKADLVTLGASVLLLDCMRTSLRKRPSEVSPWDADSRFFAVSILLHLSQIAGGRQDIRKRGGIHDLVDGANKETDRRVKATIWQCLLNLASMSSTEEVSLSDEGSLGHVRSSSSFSSLNSLSSLLNLNVRPSPDLAQCHAQIRSAGGLLLIRFTLAHFLFNISVAVGCPANQARSSILHSVPSLGGTTYDVLIQDKESWEVFFMATRLLKLLAYDARFELRDLGCLPLIVELFRIPQGAVTDACSNTSQSLVPLPAELPVKRLMDRIVDELEQDPSTRAELQRLQSVPRVVSMTDPKAPKGKKV
eukprot:ANDGO_06417.mRNA.1 hypothetical protein